MKDVFFGVVFFLAGLFTVFCAVKDYDWFMEHRRAWLFVKLFGRNGARAFYAPLGLFLIMLSVFLIIQ